MPEVSDRRTHRRFSLYLPVQVKVPVDEAAEVTATRDISARGIYFSMARDPKPGSQLECVLTLPPEICQGSTIQVRCMGRVVRVEPPGPEGRTGVAATIDRYEFLR